MQALESYYRAQRAYHLALFYAAPQRAQVPYTPFYNLKPLDTSNTVLTGWLCVW